MNAYDNSNHFRALIVISFILHLSMLLFLSTGFQREGIRFPSFMVVDIVSPPEIKETTRSFQPPVVERSPKSSERRITRLKEREAIQSPRESSTPVPIQRGIESIPQRVIEKEAEYEREIRTQDSIKQDSKKSDTAMSFPSPSKERESKEIPPPGVSMPDSKNYSIFEKKKDSPYNIMRNERLPDIAKGDISKDKLLDQELTAIQPVPLNTKEPKYLPYFEHIKRKIEDVLVYPVKAAKDGISGDLLLEFVLSREGKLRGIKIINTSGYTILDDSSVIAVQMASPFNPIPDSLDRSTIKITASFHYYLTEGFKKFNIH